MPRQQTPQSENTNNLLPPIKRSSPEELKYYRILTRNAAMQGDIESLHALNELIGYLPRSEDGTYPIEYAAANGHEDAIIYLSPLTPRAIYEKRPHPLSTAAMYAAGNLHYDCMHLLLKQCSQKLRSRTLILLCGFAIDDDDDVLLTQLLDHRYIEPDCITETQLGTSVSALNFTVVTGALKCMQSLVHYGANLNRSFTKLNPPALIAALSGNTHALTILREHGADLNAVDPIDGTGIIFALYMKQKFTTARLLIESGCIAPDTVKHDLQALKRDINGRWVEYRHALAMLSEYTGEATPAELSTLLTQRDRLFSSLPTKAASPKHADKSTSTVEATHSIKPRSPGSRAF